MKIAIIIVVVLVVAAGGGLLLAGPQITKALQGLRPEANFTEVRVEPARRGELIESISAPGEIEPRIKVELSAEVSARIEELPFREGDLVKKDDIVVKLDDRDLVAAVEAATARKEGEQARMESEKARLTGAQHNLNYARRDLERKQSLYDTGDISRNELDAALNRVDELDANVEASKFSLSVIESSLASAQADIDRANEALAKTVIRAPMDGRITMLNAEVGEVVMVGTMNNPGTVILVIADLSRMILNAQVAESDIAKVDEEQSAKLYINAYPDETFTGVVNHVALQRSGQPDGTGFFETEVEVYLHDGRQIRSGLLANVDIEIAQHEGIIVESQAIVDELLEDLPDAIRRDDPLVDRTRKTTPVVYCLVDNKAVAMPVKVGSSDATHTHVLEGLEADDQVIVGPYKVLESIKHDDRVIDHREAERQRAERGSQQGDDMREESGGAEDEEQSSGLSVRVG